MGEIYHLSEQIILQKYALEKDEQGRSQFWKIAAIEEDRRSGRDTRLLQEFVNDIEVTVDKLTIKKKPVIHTASKMVVHEPQPHTIAAEPIAPASSHGDTNPS